MIFIINIIIDLKMISIINFVESLFLFICVINEMFNWDWFQLTVKIRL